MTRTMLMLAIAGVAFIFSAIGSRNGELVKRSA